MSFTAASTPSATTHERIPITTVARTLLDLAATAPAHRLERALAQAERLRVYDHSAISDVLARSNGHRGVGGPRASNERRPEVDPQRLRGRLPHARPRHGPARALVNHVLTAPDHPYAEVDFYWPQHRLVVETDGWETHGTRAAFEADRAKDAALTAAGYRVLRFTWRTQPETAVRRVRAIMAR